MPRSKHSVIVFDAFGTLIQKVVRRTSAHTRLSSHVDPTLLPDREQFMIRSVPISTFAVELEQSHLVPQLERDLQEEIQQLRLYDDVGTMLQRLRGMGLRMGVCSNLAYDYGQAVRTLLPHFDAYIFSFEVGATKPSPRIFQKACELLNCRPQNVLYIGDSKRADLEGASRFGMDAHLIDRTSMRLDHLVNKNLRR